METYVHITSTEVADYINEIGSTYAKKYDPEYNITPDLI